MTDLPPFICCLASRNDRIAHLTLIACALSLSQRPSQLRPGCLGAALRPSARSRPARALCPRLRSLCRHTIAPGKLTQARSRRRAACRRAVAGIALPQPGFCFQEAARLVVITHASMRTVGSPCSVELCAKQHIPQPRHARIVPGALNLDSNTDSLPERAESDPVVCCLALQT